jgi:hypothetical protein
MDQNNRHAFMNQIVSEENFGTFFGVTPVLHQNIQLLLLSLSRGIVGFHPNPIQGLPACPPAY